MKKAVLFLFLMGLLLFGTALWSQRSSGDRAQLVDNVNLLAGSDAPIPGMLNPQYRYARDVQLSIVNGSVVISWSPVPNEALYYKVFSSALPYEGFSLDNSGVFTSSSWTAPLNGDQRFYYVICVYDSFVHVPGGTFLMGDTRGQGAANELPIHNVTINPFYISKYQVTQAEFSQYMQPSEEWTALDGLGDIYPAYNVSWYQAIKYCNLRSIAEGFTPIYTIDGSTDPADWGNVPTSNNDIWDAISCDWDANGYRLPTEAEWEYVARGATNTPDYLYSGSDNADVVAWHSGNGSPGCKPVGGKIPNGLGLYDMSGNVLEWCWDWFGPYGSGHYDNPTGASSGYNRTMRGGSWEHSASICRVSQRGSISPAFYSLRQGFRVCRSAATATPKFSLVGGTYTGARDIRIFTSTVDAEIYYTIDGSEPGLYSTLYSGPITISATTTIKARAFLDGRIPSRVASVSYVIEEYDPGQMVYIPSGTYTMGDTHGGGNPNELPTHSISLDHFYIGKYPVTQAEFAQYLEPGDEWINQLGQGDSHPAYNISWYHAIKYCNLRSIAEGFTPVYKINGSTDPANWGAVPPFTNATWNAVVCDWNANGYRLPTEAEWEYAARGGTNTPDYLYSGSDEINDVGWHEGNSVRKSHPVGGKAANGLMIYDMSGNVWEWCWDWYGIYGSGHLDNPTGAVSGTQRMRRGGSWGAEAYGSRVSHRVSTVPSTVNYNNGFRVCRAAACAAPTFSPTGGTFMGAVNVSLSSETPNTMIYYTTDGSTPTQFSTLYTGPIRIIATSTIKAKAFRSDWMESSMVSASFIIETYASDNMVYVPGGTFMMGDTRGEGNDNELPVHSVTLNHFYIGKYEVTQAEYLQYLPPINWNTHYGVGDNYPAFGISFYAALKYCNLRSIAEGLTPVYSIKGSTDPVYWEQGGLTFEQLDMAICNWGADGYRLPTEAEWEYAARGATDNPDYLYSGSDDINAVGWFDENSNDSTHPVGSKAPNGLGIYDMTGNVWEWCWDWYDESYYNSSPSHNPTGPVDWYVHWPRGGGWKDPASNSRVSFRYKYYFLGSTYINGFRVCRAAYMCAVPQFSLVGGTYIGEQSIIMSTNTPDAQIRYTTDGRVPSQSSTLYTGPITVSSNTIIKARAFRNDWTPSAVAEAIYTIQAFNPQEMVHVPGGTFIMGDTKGGGNSFEKPLHNVTLNSFYMGKYPVNQRHYQITMDSNPASGFGVGANHPVYNVSWYDALKYCNLRSMAEGFTPVYTINGSTNPTQWGAVPTEDNGTWNSVLCNWDANGYRLPTEAEWEYAARGGTSDPDYFYSGSDDINAVAWYSGNNTPYECKPVGGKTANGLGIYDMSGNVLEWCWDWNGAYDDSDANNPSGPASGTNRILRGGCWNYDASICRVASRRYHYPHNGTYITGFRVCRTDLTCAMPKFGLASGTYADAQNINILTDTPNAVIYYTTDGSVPTQSSFLYNGPISLGLHTTTTIRARAFRSGWMPGDIAIATYVIEEYIPREMVYVPGGTFTMGRRQGYGHHDEVPPHTVTLSPFYIGKYLVTQEEYSQYKPPRSLWKDFSGLGDRYPAYYISWYRAIKYCNLRSIEEGFTPVYSIAGSTNPADWGDVPNYSDGVWGAVICNWDANGYRLPTEAEWEYAARGGTNNPDFIFSGSDDLNAVSWNSGNSGRTTHPVGTKAANGLGIYDMTGNLIEWCWDGYGDTYYSCSPSHNPTGPESGWRTLRGGGWTSYYAIAKLYYRRREIPLADNDNIGFRICRSAQ